MRRLPALLLAAALPACAGAPATPTHEDAGPVHLRFGWKAGDTARVTEQRVRRVDLGQEQHQERKIDSAWQLAVEPVQSSEGTKEQTALGVVARDLEIQGPGVDAFRATIERAMAAGRLVVAADGTPIRVEGAAEVRDAFLGSLPAPLPAEAQAMLQAALDPAVLERKELDSWSQLVGFWLDAELELGRQYSANSAQGNSKGAAAPRFRFGATARVPCSAADAERRCVRLEMAGSPSNEEIAAAMNPLVTLLAKAAPGSDVQVESVDERIAVVAEPETLRPWSFERSRTISMKMRLGGDESRDGSVVESTIRRYDWAD